jgi:hypothetical protein
MTKSGVSPIAKTLTPGQITASPNSSNEKHSVSENRTALNKKKEETWQRCLSVANVRSRIVYPIESTGFLVPEFRAHGR